MITVEFLGLTKDELAERVIARAVEALLERHVTGRDEDGEWTGADPSPFAKAMQEKIAAKVNDAIDQIAGRHVLPNVAKYVETLCLQETNTWGEKRGKPVTFVEYLVARAHAYLTEEVDFNGKTKAQESYSWRKASTRIAYLVHQHLQYSIETAMKQALTGANEQIVGGIEAAVKIKLEEIAKSLKVQVKS